MFAGRDLRDLPGTLYKLSYPQEKSNTHKSTKNHAHANNTPARTHAPPCPRYHTEGMLYHHTAHDAYRVYTRRQGTNAFLHFLASTHF